MKKTFSLLLVFCMLASIFCPLAVSAEETPEAAIAPTINKTNDGLDENDCTNVTLSVPGEAQDYSSDIVFIIGNGPAENYTYLVDTIHKILVAADGTSTKIKLGMVGFADTTEEETVLPLTEMVDTVADNKVADYRIEGRYNDGSKYTETLADYKARKAAAFAAWEAENPTLLTDMEYIIAKALERAEDVYNGINLESALITARDMLIADNTVPAERKHMIVVSTGLTYWFDNDEGEPVTIIGTNKFGTYMHGNKYWLQARDASTNTGAGYYLPTWAVIKESGVANYQKSWTEFWKKIEGWIEKDQDAYVYNPGKTYSEFYYNGNSTEIRPQSNANYRYGYAIQNEDDIASVTGAVPYFSGGANPATTPNAAHALNYERAQYESWVVYKQMETPVGESFETVLKDETGKNKVIEGLGFHCYSIANGVSSNPGEEDRWLNSNQIGYNFMHMLGGENTVNYRNADTSFFKPIENKILYYCSVGSYVEDFIGYDEENKKDNFEFIQNPDYITMTVGGVEYTTTQVDAKDGYEFSLAFTAPGAEEPTFWLDYTYGNGKTTEKFIWTFGENVSRFNPASLTYKLLLTEKAEWEGVFVPDTNISATLYPKDSNGNELEPEEFPIPNVEYEVTAYEDVDIVIALGAGIANKTKTYDSIVSLVKPLIDEGITVKLGLVAVEHYDDVAMELTPMDANNYEAVITNGLNTIVNMPAGPTNLHGNLVAAKKMLDDDTSVPAENKFFYVIATGRTYNFDNADGVPTTIINKVALKGKTYYYWGHYLWQSQRGRHTSLYMIPDAYNNDFAAYWADVCKWIEADGDKYAYSFTEAYDPTNSGWYVGENGFFTNNTKDAKALGLASSRFGWILNDLTDSGLEAIGSGTNPQNALNYERAQYEAYKVFEEIAKAYTCQVLCSESVNYQNDSPYIDYVKYAGTSRAQLGHSFMNYLAQLAGQDSATILFNLLDANGNYEMAEDFFEEIDITKLAKKPVAPAPVLMTTRPAKVNMPAVTVAPAISSDAITNVGGSAESGSASVSVPATFALTDKNGEVLEMVEAEDGSVQFTAFNIDAEGIYNYRIYQVADPESGISENDKYIEIKIRVYLDEEANKYRSQVTLMGVEELAF